MKQFLLFVLLAAASNAGFAQTDAISKFFKQYENNENFTVISISPKMFKMMSKVKWDDVSSEVKQTINNLTSFRMLTAEKNGLALYTEAAKKLDLGSYDEIMTVKDKGENVRFFVKEANSRINELVMLVGTKSEFVLMSLTGIIDLDNINKLGSAINMKGMNNLSSVKKK
ncbi:MAG: hypothetical protein BGN92_02985 [Sphingobacteriales bacterium 41-5]|nr:MAG: hypothetical protein BGN92_02985 [Sphingobacteriales bacterium 41-5]